MDHTKEPWEAFQKDEEKGTTYWRIRFDSNSGDSLHGYCGEANACRVVACVNACAGIETERLEEAAKDPISGMFGRMAAKAHIKQRELEAELSSLRAALAEKTARVDEAWRKIDWLRSALKRQFWRAQSELGKVERLREALTDIHDYGLDRDGETTSEKLGELVDELVQISREALAATAQKEDSDA